MNIRSFRIHLRKIRNGSFETQAGFSVLEGLAGLLVLVVLAFLASKGFSLVKNNNQEGSRLKSAKEIAVVTAEALGSRPYVELQALNGGFGNWSQPLPIPAPRTGNGASGFFFRYRLTPDPAVPGENAFTTNADLRNAIASADTLLGLRIETGRLEGGVFTSRESYATLVSPQRTQTESNQGSAQARENDLYRQLMQNIRLTKSSAGQNNPNYLNPSNCYDPGECCGFLSRQFNGETVGVPTDGLDEKCYHRCYAGNMNFSQTMDQCGIACSDPALDSRSECCAKFRAGECGPGTRCAMVCRRCANIQYWSVCNERRADECLLQHDWRDNIDCARGTWCDGGPLPTTHEWYGAPNTGDILNECQKPACQTNNCYEPGDVGICCERYWRQWVRFNGDERRIEITSRLRRYCRNSTRLEQCCDWNFAYNWDGVVCAPGGRVEAVLDNQVWRCARTEELDQCQQTRFCRTTVRDPRFSGTCIDIPPPPRAPDGPSSGDNSNNTPSNPPPSTLPDIPSIPNNPVMPGQNSSSSDEGSDLSGGGNDGT